jgi:recombining binding protein (suppressor of hairless)
VRIICALENVVADDAVSGPPSVTDSGSQVPQRFGSLGSDHSIIMVDLPEMKDVMKAVSDQISADVDPPVAPSDGLSNSLGLDAANRLGMQQDKPLLPSQELVGRSLPLLFVRGCDGVGYHTGRSAVLENVLAQFDFPQTSSGMDGNWLSAAPQAMSTEISAWTLRVM